MDFIFQASLTPMKYDGIARTPLLLVPPNLARPTTCLHERREFLPNTSVVSAPMSSRRIVAWLEILFRDWTGPPTRTPEILSPKAHKETMG